LYGVFLRRRHGAFLQIAPTTAPPPVPTVFFSANGPDWPANAPPAVFFLQMARIGPPPRPLSKAGLYRFLPSQQIAPVFCTLQFFSTNQLLCKITPIFAFFIYSQKSALFTRTAILRVFLAFFIFAPIFQKQEFFCARQKSGFILTKQKEGGFFILSRQNSTLN